MENQTHKYIELPMRLTKEDADLVSKLLSNYEWLLTIITPTTKIEELFVKLDKERLQMFKARLSKASRT